MRYTVSVVPAMCSLIGIVLMLLYKLDAPTLARLRANAPPS
jgi:Na+/melibiose symporter-like transporter